jgi:hypothetical protein
MIDSKIRILVLSSKLVFSCTCKTLIIDCKTRLHAILATFAKITYSIVSTKRDVCTRCLQYLQNASHIRHTNGRPLLLINLSVTVQLVSLVTLGVVMSVSISITSLSHSRSDISRLSVYTGWLLFSVFLLGLVIVNFLSHHEESDKSWTSRIWIRSGVVWSFCMSSCCKTIKIHFQLDLVRLYVR